MRLRSTGSLGVPNGDLEIWNSVVFGCGLGSGSMIKERDFVLSTENGCKELGEWVRRHEDRGETHLVVVRLFETYGSWSVNAVKFTFRVRYDCTMTHGLWWFWDCRTLQKFSGTC
jgi:hypothetical protein